MDPTAQRVTTAPAGAPGLKPSPPAPAPEPKSPRVFVSVRVPALTPGRQVSQNKNMSFKNSLHDKQDLLLWKKKKKTTAV